MNLSTRWFNLKARWPYLALALILVSSAFFLFAYNHEQDDVNGPVKTQWCDGNFNFDTPCQNQVSWSFGPPPGSNVVTTGGPSYQQVIGNAFASWQQASLNGQSLVNITIQGPVALSNPPSTPNAGDCQNVVGFTDTTKSDFPTGTIAFTSILTTFGCTVSGSNCPSGTPPNTYNCPGSANPNTVYTCPLQSCMVDADIEFNPAETFTTASTTPANDFDLQAIATHEIGHLLGMDHSGLASAIMFAFGDAGGVPSRALSVDDAIGIGSIYPSVNFSAMTGTLSGSVSLSSKGIFGAHVVVIDASSGNAVTDAITNQDGSYSIAGVPPGQYNVIALPLAGIYDLTNFSGWACGYGENVPPCCDPTQDTSCNKTNALSPPTNYSGKFN
ncbi:MAG: matrixin family metalloprotease [Acidobacteriota bacterium]|nr:matrixin family metalloprotease [Acidobacteriota bacterium]